MQNKSKRSYFKAGVVLCLFAGFVTAILLMVSFTEPIVVEQVITTRSSWQQTQVYGNYTGIARGASTVMGVFIVTQGLASYSQNMTNGSAYTGKILVSSATGTHAAANNSHLSSTVNHSTALDIVLMVAWNKSHAFETANNTWVLQYVNCTVHNSVMGINGVCTDYNITNWYNQTADYHWVNHVINCSALSRGQSVNGSGGVGAGWTGILCNFTYYG